VVAAIWAGPAQDATAQAAPGVNPWTVFRGPAETSCEGEKETVRIPLFVQLAARDIPRTGGTLSQIVVHFGLEGAPDFEASNGERYPLIGDYFSAGTQAPDANEWAIVLTPHPWAGTPPSGYYDFSDNYDLGPGPHRFNVEVLYWWADDGVGADDPPTEVKNLFPIDVVSPNCSTTPPPPPPPPTAAERAAAAARARTGLNTAQATPEDLATLRAAGVLDREWGPSPLVGEWSGDCPKLPFLAWYLATGIKLEHRHAFQNAEYYMEHPADPSPPPVGAVVFYGKTGGKNGNPLGHEAISLGEGLVATTRGMDHDHKNNEVMAFRDASQGDYLGYYLPP
jgi:hypothetical protein